MPSRGLPSVKQEFSADGTEYVEAIRQLIQVNRELLVSVNLVEHESEEMSRSFAQVKASVAGLKTEIAGLKGSVGELKESFASMAEVTDTIEEVRTTLISVKDTIREVSATVDDSSLSLGSYADQHIAVGRAVDSVAASHEQLQRVIGRTSDIAADQVAALEEMYSAADAPAMAVGRLSDAYDNIGVSVATARDITVSGLRAQGDELDKVLVKAAAVNAEMARVPVLAGAGGPGGFSSMDAAFSSIVGNMNSSLSSSVDAAFSNIITNSGLADQPAHIQREIQRMASRVADAYTPDQVLEKLAGGSGRSGSGNGKGYGGGSGLPPPPPGPSGPDDYGYDAEAARLAREARRKAAEASAAASELRRAADAEKWASLYADEDDYGGVYGPEGDYIGHRRKGGSTGTRAGAEFEETMTPGLIDAMREAYARNRDIDKTEAVDPEVIASMKRLQEALGMVKDASGRATDGQKALAASFIEDMPLEDQLIAKYGLAKKVAEGLAGDMVEVPQTAYTAGDMVTLQRVLAAQDRAGASGTSPDASAALLGAAAATLAGGGGGGGASGGSGGGGGLRDLLAATGGGGGFGIGTSARQSAATLDWLTTWYPRFHYAMMAFNEVMATLGPATVAAGAGAAVGLQGGQTAFDRIKAINAVGQSLGAYSLNETPGQALGLGDSLQQAQNMADTGVWELMGAGLNSVKAATDTASGGLGNFWQMGTNVIDMLDRFSANMTLAFKGGAGNQLSGIISGGTQDLQQFGQVLGNVGHLFMNVVPALPGVGGDILATLDAGTRGLSNAAGFLNSTGLLGPGLAFEAASRYGPALLGTFGRGVGTFGEFGGKVLGGTGDLIGGAGSLLESAGTALVPEGAELGLADYAALGAVSAGIGLRGAGSKLTGSTLSRLFGSTAKVATAEDVAGGALTSAGTVAAEGDIIGGTGVAGAIGGMGAVDVGALGALAYVFGKAFTSKTPAQQAVGSLETTIGDSDASGGYTNLLAGLNKVSGQTKGKQNLGVQGSFNQEDADLFEHGNIYGALKSEFSGFGAIFGGSGAPTPAGTYSAATQQMAGQMNDLLNAGQQVQALAKQSGEGSISLQTAYGLLNQSGVQLATGFKGGNLSATSDQQILNAITGYQAMHQNAGAFGSNVAAVQTEQGLSGSNLPAVNSAWDAFTSNVAGGTSAASSLYQSLAGMQTLGASLAVAKTPAETATQRAEAAHASAEAAVSASKDASNVAKALTSLSSTSGASAWAALSSTSTSSPGLIQQASTMMDWLRTAGASGNIGGSGGAISGVQMTGAAGYLTKQLLPYGKDSPAALAEIASVGQQGGIAGSVYNPGESLAENYKNISKAVDTAASSQKEYNKTISQGTINMSDVSAQAENFGSSVGSDVVSAMENASANLPKASADMTQFAESMHRGTSSFNGQGLKSVVQDLQNAGASGGSIGAIISKSMSMHGVTQGGISSALKEVNSDIGSIVSKKNSQISLSVKANTGGLAQLKAAIAATEAGSKDITIGTKVDTSGVTKLKAALSGVHGDTLMVKTAADMSGINAAKAGLASVQNKTVTVTTHYVSVGSPSSVSGGALGRYLHSASGMRLPGYGGGDIVPAMLEPGEAVVPKHLVSMVAPLLAGRVPGFASGGIVTPGMASMMQAMTGVQASAQIAAALGSGPMGGAANTLTNSLSYISGRYGSPANAAAHQAQFGWYDNGGLLMPGLTLALNTTGAPEAVMGPMSAGGGPAGSQAGGPPMAFGLSAAMQQLLADLNAELKKSGLGKGLAVSILSGISAGMADSLGKEGLSKLAKNLVNQVSTEVKYAKSVAANTVSGLGFSSLDPSNGSITSQMQSYLTSIGQFSNAIGQLSAGGLNKTLLTQLISAGPSALPEAQAILGQSSSAVAASTTSSAISGLNFASIDPTQGPVAQQMGTYTSSLQSFNKDIKALSKDGLNKNLLNQLIAAGPSSDPLAQSILGAGSTGGNQVKAVNQAYAALSKAAGQFGKTAGKTEGGGGKSEISAINKLYSAITKAAASFGAKAAGAKYGGVVAPNLKSGTFTTNNVTINVTTGGGGGGGGSTTLSMSNSQLKKLMAEIEKKLLQQAKRNRKTGVALPGYGS